MNNLPEKNPNESEDALDGITSIQKELSRVKNLEGDCGVFKRSAKFIDDYINKEYNFNKNETLIGYSALESERLDLIFTIDPSVFLEIACSYLLTLEEWQISENRILGLSKEMIEEMDAKYQIAFTFLNPDQKIELEQRALIRIQE